MADKEIVNLPAASEFYDDAMIPAYIPGAPEPAQRLSGAQLRVFAEMAAASVRSGATFIPHLKENGDLYWTNNAGLENPPTINIMGPAGGVNSFNGRVGAVTPQSGDYALAQITGLTEALNQKMYANRGSAKDLGYTSLADIILDGVYKIVDGPSFLSDYPVELSKNGFNYATLWVLPHNGYLTKKLFATNGASGDYATAEWVAGSPWKVIATTDYALPRNGSEAMTSGLRISNGWAELSGSDAGVFLFAKKSVENNALMRALFLASKNYSPDISGGAFLRDFDSDGAAKDYTILHTGNKPSGSYTGNGSAVRDPINTGGIGSVMLLYSQAAMLIVGVYGGFGYVWSGSEQIFKKISWGECLYKNGVLTIATSDLAVNDSGITYYYQVL